MAEIDNLSISISTSAAAAIAELDKLATSLTRFSGASRKVKTSADSVNKGFEDVASSTQKAETHTSSFADKLGKLQSTLSKTVPKLKELGNAALSIGKVSFSPVTSAFTSLGNSAKGAMSSVSGLFSTISRIAFYRAIRSAIKEITQGISDGIKNLYHYSETFNGTFYKSMNQIATEAQYLKNSLGAMFQPLIEYVTPFVTFITDKLVGIINLVNQFISALTGKSTYTAAKKVAAVWDDSSKKTKKTADNTKKASNNAKKLSSNFKKTSSNIKDAADELKRFTLGFDELNILGKNVAQSTGGLGGSGTPSTGGTGAKTPGTSAATAGTTGTDYSSMFQSLNISSAIKALADEIKKYIKSGNWEGLGKAIGDKVEWLIDNIDFAKYGSKVGKAINAWFTTKYWTLDTINFRNLGDKIAVFLNNAIKQINFEIIGRSMVQEFTIVGDLIIGFFTGFNWGQAASAFSAFVKGAYDELTKWLKKYNWEDLGATVYDSVIDIFNNADFEGMARSFFTFLGTALRASSMFSQGVLGSIATSIKIWFIKDIMGHSWTDIAFNILSAIGKGFSNIGQWVYDNVIDPFMSALLGEDWDKLKPVAKNVWDVINENWIANNFVLDLIVGVVNDAKKWVSDTMKWWDEEGRDKVASFVANVKNNASEWWDNVQKWWAEKAVTILKFAANVKNDASEWWGNVKKWWAIKVGDVQSFTTRVKNDASTWWSNTKTWWSEKVGNVQDFLVNVNNTSAKWWSNVVNWWKDILGLNDGTGFKEFRINIMNFAPTWLKNVINWWKNVLGLNDGSEFTEFKINIMNKAANWLSNVVRWWRGELGSNDGSRFKEFTVKVKQEAWNWWNQVSSAWNNWTRNLSLSAEATVYATYRHTGAYGSFAEGGSIDAYGNIRRFANGGVIHAYAGGTSRAQGSLFLAGEAGPEIVGHVGGRTEVLNKSQLAATMYAAVNAAMAPAAANFASAAAYMYEGANGYAEDDMEMLLQLVRAGSEATQRQNELLRQQNEYLRQINAKEFSAEISTADINRAQARSNRRAGTTIVPMTT